MFGKFIKNASKYIKNINTKKVVISGAGVGASLMAYDSFVFMKQTAISEEYGIDFRKYTTCEESFYSYIMRPIRNIKDFFWINDIHHKLIKGKLDHYDGKYRSFAKHEYTFLNDYPYPKRFLDAIECGSLNPREEWLEDVFFEEFEKNTKNDVDYRNLYTTKQLQILDIFSKNPEHYKSNFNFVERLLCYGSRRYEKQPVYFNTIEWCLSKAIEFPEYIYLSGDTISKLPSKYYNPDNIGNFGDENKFKNIVLCKNKTYLLKVLEYYPDYFTNYYNNYGTNAYAEYFIHKFIKSTRYFDTGSTLNLIFNSFPHKMQVYIASQLFAKAKDKINTFLQKESNLIECLQYLNRSGYDIYYPSIKVLTDIGYRKKTIIELIENGHYQVEKYKFRDDTLDEIINNTNNSNISIEKVLMNQKNLKSDIVQKLFISYAQQNPLVTWIEHNSFIKKYQPKYHQEMYN
uniref:Uncharacterized protein n=1 Tax=viral metagenome TaxID=1070528 RepID=A0A6C0E9V1_9ZZZZ